MRFNIVFGVIVCGETTAATEHRRMENQRKDDACISNNSKASILRHLMQLENFITLLKAKCKISSIFGI